MVQVKTSLPLGIALSDTASTYRELYHHHECNETPGTRLPPLGADDGATAKTPVSACERLVYK